MEIKGRGVGGLVFGLVVILVVVAVALLLINSSSIVRTVPDQTNDEMEVAPS